MKNEIRHRGSYRHARRRAERIPEIAQRHAHHPALAARTPTLLQVAADLVAAYDDDNAHAASTQTVLDDADATIDALHVTLGPWITAVKLDMPGFIPDRFALAKRSNDDIIVGAKLLLDSIHTHAEAHPPLTYASALAEAVRPALDAADAANTAAKLARVTQKQERQALREAAARMHHAVVQYRRVLRSVIGRSHPDYRALRIRAASRSEGGGDAVTAESEEAPEDESRPTS